MVACPAQLFVKITFIINLLFISYYSVLLFAVVLHLYVFPIPSLLFFPSLSFSPSIFRCLFCVSFFLRCRKLCPSHYVLAFRPVMFCVLFAQAVFFRRARPGGLVLSGKAECCGIIKCILATRQEKEGGRERTREEKSRS